MFPSHKAKPKMLRRCASGMKKVGIYSGTFDPVHDGHIAFARDAIKQRGLDKVFFLVEPRPRRKQGVKAMEHRVAMVQLAIKDDDKLGSIVLEQQRFTATDTLPVLTERFKGAELYLLMGDDMLSHFASWPHVEELIRGVKFVIGIRKFTRTEVNRRLKIIQRTRGLALDYSLFKASKSEHASTSIRMSFRKGKVPAGVNPAVAKYIQQEGLYSVAGS